MTTYWFMFWISIGITAYLCYCWGKGKMVYPKFRRDNRGRLRKLTGNYYVKDNGHPSACTCVDCTDIRLRKAGLRK
jgi:hypothetical protein